MFESAKLPGNGRARLYESYYLHTLCTPRVVESPIQDLRYCTTLKVVARTLVLQICTWVRESVDARIDCFFMSLFDSVLKIRIVFQHARWACVSRPGTLSFCKQRGLFHNNYAWCKFFKGWDVGTWCFQKMTGSFRFFSIFWRHFRWMKGRRDKISEIDTCGHQ